MFMEPLAVTVAISVSAWTTASTLRAVPVEVTVASASLLSVMVSSLFAAE